MIAHTFVPPRQYTPPQQVHSGAAASGSLPVTTARHFTRYDAVVLKNPWVLSVNVRMDSTDELDVRVAGVLSHAPEVLTVYCLHVSTEVVWTCSAFYISRTNPEGLAGQSCWLQT